MGRVVKYQADDSRQLGSPIPVRRYAYVPPVAGAMDWLRVQILFRVLLFHEEIGEKAFECFKRLAMEWAMSYPLITPECHTLGSTFIKNYFLVDNSTLLPHLLADYYHLVIVDEAGAEAAASRVDFLARDPTPLGRPTGKEGRDYYSKVQSGRRTQVSEQKWERVDVGTLWRFAEAWVEVRHKLVPALTSFVHEQTPRKYTRRYKKAGCEEPEFSDQYRNWQAALKHFDNSLRRTDWPVHPF